MTLVSDYLLFLKLFIFLLFVQWLLSKVGNNRFLFVVGMLIGGYYIFFMRWSVLGIILVGFLVFILSGVGTFMQDIIFQYSSVMEEERLAEAERYSGGFMGMLRRY